jgi:mono/diheme cytochrome c family protein
MKNMKTRGFIFVILLLPQLGLTTVAAAQQRRSDVILLSASVADQSAKNPYAGKDEARLAGQKLFHRYCEECHGQAGVGAVDAPSLQTQLVRSTAPGALFSFLKNGNLRQGMPSWSRLPDAQVWQIVTFLHSFAK